MIGKTEKSPPTTRSGEEKSDDAFWRLFIPDPHYPNFYAWVKNIDCLSV